MIYCLLFFCFSGFGICLIGICNFPLGFGICYLTLGMKYIIIIVVVIASLTFSSCLKIGEYYAGLNLQPEMSNSPFTPGLNVFGVLKTGPDFDTINHYFEVQQLLNIADWSDTLNIVDASIQLVRLTEQGTANNYTLKSTSDVRYIDTTIVVAPGDQWTYVCSYDTFEVTSSCLVPNRPKLIDGSVINEASRLRFTIASDETAFMYLVYLIDGVNVQYEQKVPIAGAQTTFDLSFDWSANNEPRLLYVFAYDQKLEEYYTTSNTFFKPNAYRPLFSTVEGGYGTFGAVSSSLFTIE